jgi:hypothetical protein
MTNQLQRGHGVLTDQLIKYAESADGTRIAYRRFGSARPLIFVGGAQVFDFLGGPSTVIRNSTELWDSFIVAML